YACCITSAVHPSRAAQERGHLRMTGPASNRPDHALAEPDLVFSCRDASVEFARRDGPRCVLDRISLDLRRGEVLTVVGPSGTGKTTLLRLLGGLTPSTQ